jgi:hypothetical protein
MRNGPICYEGSDERNGSVGHQPSDRFLFVPVGEEILTRRGRDLAVL